MDFLSQRQLYSYESIINKIQREHEKSQTLQQEIDRINNMLVLSNLANLTLTQKLGHINVKIFSNLFDLYTLYHNELKADISSFSRHENCKFYLVEVLITNTLQRKLKDMDWSLFLSIKYEGTLISKTIKMLEYELPILEVLPVNSNIMDCQVSASIILQSKEGLTHVLLDSVNLDVSYHFENVKKTKVLTTERKILEISKAHNPDLNINALKKPLLVEYSFFSKKDKHDFIKHFIQHCYHKLDLELFSELGSDSTNRFLVKFSTGSAKSSLTFNKESQVVTLRSNLSDMEYLKNYFWNEGTYEIRDLEKLKTCLKDLLSKLSHCNTKDDLCNFYIAVRTIWTK